ncbi:MAG: WGxxGxxG family protein [Candidatus Dormibacteria bacterium]
MRKTIATGVLTLALVGSAAGFASAQTSPGATPDQQTQPAKSDDNGKLGLLGLLGLVGLGGLVRRRNEDTTRTGIRSQ